MSLNLNSFKSVLKKVSALKTRYADMNNPASLHFEDIEDALKEAIEKPDKALRIAEDGALNLTVIFNEVNKIVEGNVAEFKYCLAQRHFTISVTRLYIAKNESRYASKTETFYADYRTKQCIADMITKISVFWASHKQEFENMGGVGEAQITA